MTFPYHATVTFEAVSGNPRDRVVNSFAFDADAAILSADADTLATRLETFYHTLSAPGIHPIDYYFSPALSRVVKPILRIYPLDGHLDGSASGSFSFARTFANNLTAPGNVTPLPSECAIVLSFHASYGLDVEFAPGARPRARDRGRIFLGPLNLGCQVTSANSNSIVSAQCMSDIANAAKTLRDGSATTRWSVWSRRNQRMTAITTVSVDEAMDSQRRRGQTSNSVKVL